jgi:hypothetical protein
MITSEALDRPTLAEIQRLALRNALDHVEQDDVAQLADGGQVSQRAADIAGADQRDFLASHRPRPPC